MKKFLVAVIASLAFAATAQMKVATGPADGTYTKMFNEVSNACGTDLHMTGVNTSGSNENVDLLAGNQVNAAFSQGDVLFLRGQNEDFSKIRTLVALHPEQVHIISLVDPDIKVGGTMGFGGQKVQFSELGQLRGFTIGASGGAVTTANVIRLQSQVAYNVVSFDSNKDAIAALTAKKIQAVLWVGGAPVPGIAALDGRYRLVSIPPANQEALKAVYTPGARLNYRGMNAAGIPTVSIDALFVTWEYSTVKMTSALSAFRKCFISNLADIQEKTGNHPAWKNIKADNKGKWPWYNLQ